MATDFDRDDRLHGLLRDTLRRQPASGPCVDAATLAAWAEDALTPEETAAADTHLATCARCRELAAALSTMTEAEGAPAAVVVPFPPRPAGRWKVITGAMGAVAASVLIWVAVRDGSPSLDTAPEAIRAEQTPAHGVGGNIPAPAPAAAEERLPGAQDSSARQQRADATREAERRQGQLGQQALGARPPEAKLADASAARAATPSQSSTKPSPAPVEPPARTTPPLPPAVAAPTPTPLPPPPAAPAPTATAGAARSSTVAGLPQSTLNIDITGIKPADPATGGFFATAPIIAEFVVRADLQPPEGQSFGGAVADRTRAGGAGRGGGGGSSAAAGGRAGGAATVAGGAVPVRWRLRGESPRPYPAMAALERSNDAGATWQQVPIPVLTTPLLVGGSAPTNAVCWLVGRTGIVLVSTDGTTFRQVTKPVDADLVSVRATDARSATVRTADGRTFTTTDGGMTWTPRSDGPSQ